MGLITIYAIWQLCASVLERIDRKLIYEKARNYSISVGKPLIVMGGTKGRHGSGDICIDIDPKSCQGALTFLWGDIRAIPLPDKFAGAVFASHVLEHLYTVHDARIALAELLRIADRVYIVYPHKWNPMAWLHPGHHIWVSINGNYVLFEQR
jgi:hypothetical protein